MAAPEQSVAYASCGRVALLFNKRAHRNKGSLAETLGAPFWEAAPTSKAELDHTLAHFAREKIGTIVIAGGDGTVRDVLSRAHRHFPAGLPRFAIVPSGKTNALAGDLGLVDRPISEVLSRLSRARTVRRSPIEIRYGEEIEPRLRGFVFGTGAFVRTTRLAQSVHRAGWFNGLAVGLSLVRALGQIVFASAANEWRRGDIVSGDMDGRKFQGELFMLLGSTLERMPLGFRPFGRVHDGLKLLSVDAPPRRVLLAAAALAAGSERPWLHEAGYRRADADRLRLHLDGEFVLDGERFPGGDLTIGKGAPVDFLVPE